MSETPLIVFPSSPSSLEEPWRLTAAEYRNRADLFEAFHVEARDSAEGPVAFAAFTVGAESGDRPHLACRVEHAGDYFRLCAEFPTAPLALGDLIHLQWVVRARSIEEDESERGIEELLLACDGSRRGKLTSDKLSLGDDLSEWTRAEALLQVVKVAEAGLLHLSFIVPSGVQVDVAAVQAVKLGRLEPGEPTLAAVNLGQARLARPVERLTLDPDEPLFRSSQALGFVDQLRPDRVRGWALRAAAPAEEVRLELRLDGRPRAQLAVRPPTPDFAGLGALAFEAQLGEELMDGEAHSVEVRFADGEPLRRSPGQVRMTHRVEGLVEYDPVGATLTGWAIDLLDLDHAAAIEILADGEVVGQVLADQPHPVLTSSAYRGGRCAFRFPLPAEVGRDAEAVLTARLGGVGLDLPGGPIRVQRAGTRYVFGLTGVDADAIRGWAADLSRPGEAVPLRIEIDGLPAGAATADLPAGDFGRRAFSLPLPGRVETIAFSAAETGERLGTYALDRRTARPVSSAPAGDVDRAAKAVDTAWYHAAHPDIAEADARRHWRETGGPAGLSPTAWFDEAWYRREHAEVAEAIAAGALHSGFSHWIGQGAAEGRRPGPGVDPAHLGELVDWLLSGSRRPPTPLAAEARPRGRRRSSPPVADEREDLTAAMAPRAKGRTTVYDSMVENMLRDVALVDRRKAAGAREELALSEAEILRRLWANPLQGAPLVSVIMPTFNRAFVIAEAIQSVLDQSWPHWELLVCDDGSLDRTQMVVQAFRDPRIRYLKLEKANGASARNYGLKFARGEFLAFLDSDNVWHPNFLALGLGTLQRRPGVDFCYTGFIDTQTTGARYADAVPTFREFDYPALLFRNFIDLNTLFLRRSLYEELGGFDADLPRVQDWDLVLKYAQFAEPIAIHAYPAFYRRNLAWGQVTDLYAHLNFNQLVRERAAARLEAGQPPVGGGLGRRAALTVIAGPAESDAADALGFLRAAEGIADVRLVLPERDAVRRLVADSGVETFADVVWTDRPDPALLWGEALVLADAGGGLEPERLAAGGSWARLTRREDAFRLEFDGDPQDYAWLGGLSALAPDRAPEPAEPTGELLVVFAPAAERAAWSAELLRRSQKRGPALLAALGATREEDRFVLHVRGRVEAVDAGRADGLLRWRAALVAAPLPPALAERAFGLHLIPALANGPLLLASEAPVFAALLREKGAWPLTNLEPAAVLTAIDEALTDEGGAARSRAAVLARRRRVHRAEMVRERLRRVFARWLGLEPEVQAA